MTKEKLNQLIEYVTTERFSDEIHKAKKEYYKIAGELFEDDKTYENRMTTFLEWYLFDRLLTDKTITPLELFIEENRDKLTLEYIHAYEGFLRSIHGLFIIKKIKDDQVVVYNLFDENKYVVSEKEGSIFFHKNDIFEGRIIPFNDKYFFTGTFCYHPKDALKFIKTEAKRLLNERKHLEKAVLYFMQLDSIDYLKVAANITLLFHTSRDKSKDYAKSAYEVLSPSATPSMDNIVSNPTESDTYPNWFRASYPDVVLWFAKLSEDYCREILNRDLSTVIKEDDLKKLRRIVDAYKEERLLECTKS